MRFRRCLGSSGKQSTASSTAPDRTLKRAKTAKRLREAVSPAPGERERARSPHRRTQDTLKYLKCGINKAVAFPQGCDYMWYIRTSSTVRPRPHTDVFYVHPYANHVALRGPSTKHKTMYRIKQASGVVGTTEARKHNRVYNMGVGIIERHFARCVI